MCFAGIFRHVDLKRKRCGGSSFRMLSHRDTLLFPHFWANSPFDGHPKGAECTCGISSLFFSSLVGYHTLGNTIALTHGELFLRNSRSTIQFIEFLIPKGLKDRPACPSLEANTVFRVLVRSYGFGVSIAPRQVSIPDR